MALRNRSTLLRKIFIDLNTSFIYRERKEPRTSFALETWDSTKNGHFRTYFGMAKRTKLQYKIFRSKICRYTKVSVLFCPGNRSHFSFPKALTLRISSVFHRVYPVPREELQDNQEKLRIVTSTGTLNRRGEIQFKCYHLQDMKFI